MPNRNVLYRIYNADGALLYVGATTSLTLRIQSHEQTQPWWDDAANIKIERFNTFDQLLTAETEAIQREDPKYNLLHAKPPVWSYKPRRTRGGGSFYRRSDGLWVGRIELDAGPEGKRQTKQVTSKDRQTALHKFEALKAAHGQA